MKTIEEYTMTTPTTQREADERAKLIKRAERIAVNLIQRGLTGDAHDINAIINFVRQAAPEAPASEQHAASSDIWYCCPRCSTTHFQGWQAECMRCNRPMPAPAATTASAPARTQAGRDFDVEQAARAIESYEDYELANRLRHAWKVQCAATTASADQARDLLRTLINERYESQAQAARTWHMLPQVLNDMLQGRRALSDFVLAKLGLRPVVMYEKDE